MIKVEKLQQSPILQLYTYIGHSIMEASWLDFPAKGRGLIQLARLATDMDKMHILADMYGIPLYDNDGTCLWELHSK